MTGNVPTYGQNLRRLRGERKQEHLARAANKARQANLPSYEGDRRFPTPALVTQHAAMLGCSTADLMLGVVTQYDRVRWPDLTDGELEALLGALGVMAKDHRLALADSLKAQTAASLARAVPSPASAPSLAKTGTTRRTHR